MKELFSFLKRGKEKTVRNFQNSLALRRFLFYNIK